MPGILLDYHLIPIAGYIYNPSTLAWERMQQPVLEAGSVVVGSVNQGAAGSIAWLVTPSKASALTSAAVDPSGGSILAANTNRRGAMIFHKTGGIVYVGLGFAPTATEFTFALEPGDLWEMPQPIFTGAIQATAGTPQATLMVTEVT